MLPHEPPVTSNHASGGAGSHEMLTETLSRILVPLTRLCIANGVTFASVEEMLKRAFVQAAQHGAPTQQAVSRISTATGIRRREVTRLLSSDHAPRQTTPPLATQVFARWTTAPEFRDRHGAPCALKRQGPEPSFESLAQSITRDVHPRTLLEELIRLGLASHDQSNDHVNLTCNEFVPNGDSREMLHLLAGNVGDHCDAAVSNVLNDGRRHFEQAVFADELSQESLEALRPLVTAQWQALCDAMVPALTAFIKADAEAGRPQNQRVRIGLYTFSETTRDNAVPAANTPAAAPTPSKGVCK